MRRRRSDCELERLLGEVGMGVAPIAVEFTPLGGPRERVDLRVIVPSAKSWFEDLLRDGWAKRGDPGAHLLALRLWELADLATLWKRRNRRRFDHDYFRKSSMFREISRTLGRTESTGDMIARLHGEVSDDVEVLLERARYARPLGEPSVDHEAYLEFRKTVLDEIAEFETFFSRQCALRYAPCSVCRPPVPMQ